MLQKSVFAVVAMILLVSLASASVDYTVGVRSGEWIEYSVSCTGTPMQGHDVTRARMDILEVSGSNISVSITSQFANGSSEVTNSTLNLQTGHLIDDFIIPAGLEVGDRFPDENLGTVTITGKQTSLYAGVERVVLSASVGNNTYVWDQATGVSVEGSSQTDQFTVHTVAEATNMWAPPPQGFSLETIVLLAAVFVIITAVVFAFTAWYMRRKACQRRKQLS